MDASPATSTSSTVRLPLRRAGRIVFGPSESLMRRLKLPWKFLLVAVLLITPFVGVGRSYLDSQDSQANFAVGERAGIRAVGPMTQLLGAVQGARAAAAAGRAVSAIALTTATGRVDAVLAGDRTLEVSGPWSAVKARIDALLPP